MELFKQEFSLERRKEESAKLQRRHPEYIPIILYKIKETDPDVPKHKYLIKREDPASKFIMHVRNLMKANPDEAQNEKPISLKPDEALFFFTGNEQFSGQVQVGNVYEQHKDEDGFLYIQYGLEHTFGWPGEEDYIKGIAV